MTIIQNFKQTKSHLSMKIYLPFILLVGTSFFIAFLLHIDHRTLIASQNNLGKDSTFQTYVSGRDKKLLPRPGWGDFLLCNEWSPLLNKQNIKLQDDKLVFKISKEPMQTILRSVKYDLSKVNVSINFEGVSGFEQINFVLKVYYAVKEGQGNLLKSKLSEIHKIKVGQNTIKVDLQDAEWGFFEIIAINNGPETDLILGSNINSNFEIHH